MSSAAQVLDVARSQLGVVEDPPGSNRVGYAAWAGIQGLAWCGAFVCWVLDQAGALDVPRFVWTPAGAQAYRDRSRWGTEPRPAAVVFFQWPGMSRIAHVGLVEAPRDDGSVVTIEGNTDAKGGRTGGKVMRQVRRANIVGYGYPSFVDLAAPAPPPAPKTGPILRRGSRGDAVRYVQGKVGAAADGIFGPKTDAAVKAFQRSHGLVVDGIVGPRTWAAIG